MPTITPNLWFDTESEEAANFYVSIFPDSSIDKVSHYGEAGPREAGLVLTVDFTLDGQRFERAMKAMLGMVKLDIAELQRAYDGTE